MASPTDPRYSGQDVIRCTLCEFAVAPMYCEVCHIDLCKDCVEKHLADKSKLHKVVSLKQYLSTLRNPECSYHQNTQCELFCENCDLPICLQCVTSKTHKHHDCVDLKGYYQQKQEVLRRDLQELEQNIYPIFQQAASNIPIQKADQRTHAQKLTSAVQKHGKVVHAEIDIIIKSMETEIDAMATQQLAALDKQEDLINKTIREITQTVQDLKNSLETCDVRFGSVYKSKIEEFRKLPLKRNVILPNFSPVKIKRDQIVKLFGSLSPLSIETEEQDITLSSPGAESSPPARPLLDVPRLITDIPTSGNFYLYNVSCLSDEEIWTSGDNKILKFYNLKGKLLKSVQTKSGHKPQDIAVIRSGDLVYADKKARSINLVSVTQIQALIKLLVRKSNIKTQTLIKLRRWTPLGLCSTSTGDLLVIMESNYDDSDDDESDDDSDDDYDDNDDDGTRVVRYSGSTKTQNIQWDDQGEPLYSSGSNVKYISENRNLDICVVDNRAGAVVVVSAAGKLRFRYTGPPSIPQESFYPVRITTDSQANILTSDCENHRIHIIDKDGHFLHYINNCSLQCPFGLCVDSRDNLFVTERETGKVKKIQYYK